MSTNETPSDGTIFTRRFWKETAERAIKSCAQSLIFLAGAGAVNLFKIGWQQVLIGAVGYTLISILTSITTASVKGKPTADATK